MFVQFLSLNIENFGSLTYNEVTNCLTGEMYFYKVLKKVHKFVWKHRMQLVKFV